MDNSQERKAPKQKTDKNILSRFNTFKCGFCTGLLVAILAAGGIGHLILNVFKIGSVTIADRSFGEVASPDSTVDETIAEAGDESTIEQSAAEVNDSEDTNQIVGEGTIQEGENNSSVESGDTLTDGSITGET
ncbi:MAG: hypothetical protein AAFQ89_12660, partial [Cyanobacteria bacterium J06626_18]